MIELRAGRREDEIGAVEARQLGEDASRPGHDRHLMLTSFLTRAAGIVHMVRSALSSLHRMPATSSRRGPVKIKSWTNGPNG